MRLLSIILFLLVLLPSCRKGEAPSYEEDDNNVEKPKYVWFSSGISVEVQSDALGRSAIDTDRLPGYSEIGVFGIRATESEQSTLGDRINGDAECQEYLENVKYVVEPESGLLQQENLAEWPNNSSGYEGLSFYAYFPYDLSITRNSIQGHPQIEDSYYSKISLDNSDMSLTKDYLYTGKIYENTPSGQTDTKVKLLFKHALSRIKFVIESTKPGVSTHVYKIVVNANCGKDGKFYIADGTCKPDKTTSLNYTYKVNQDLTTENSIQADFLLFPNVMINYIDLYINSEYEDPYTIYDSLDDEPIYTLSNGSYLTYKIKFSPKNVDVTDEVSQWEPSPENDKDVSFDEATGEVTQN